MNDMRKELRRAVPAAVATMLVAVLLPRDAGLQFLALVLGAAAGIYVGFAVLDGRKRELGIELAGLALFILFALLGLRLSPYLLAAGFLLHIAWDYAHHPRGLQTKIVSWYLPACMVYDGLVGGFILIYWAF